MTSEAIPVTPETSTLPSTDDPGSFSERDEAFDHPFKNNIRVRPVDIFKQGCVSRVERRNDEIRPHQRFAHLGQIQERSVGDDRTGISVIS